MTQGEPDHEPTRPMRVPRPAPGWYASSGGLRFWDGSGWTEHHAPAPPPGPPPAATVPGPGPFHPGYGAPSFALVSDARTNVAEATIAWILTVLTLGYLFPWAIAASRGKSNSWAVGLVNFLLGWTLVGWVVSLVMACTPHGLVSVRTY